MSRVSRHKGKHGGKSSEIFSEDNCDDGGTAARTRPLSFGEIMSKRESKKLVCDGEKEGIVEEVSRVGNAQNVMDRGKEQRSHRSTEKNSEMGKEHNNDRSTQKISERGKEHRSGRSIQIVSEGGKEHRSDRSTQIVSEGGKEHKSDRSTQKVSEGGKEQRIDRSTQKVSERGKEHRSDRSTQKFSERGEEHRSARSTDIVSERGKEEISRGSTEKVSETGKEQRRNRINGEESERGKEQRDDRGAGKVLARGKERNNDRNTENVLERGKGWNNNRNTEHYLGRPKQENNNRYTEKVSERGSRQSEHRNTKIVSERGDQRLRDKNPEKVLERGGRQGRDLSPVIEKHLSDRDTKASSKKAEENVLMKDGPLTKSRFCETHDSEAKLKEKIDRDLKAKGNIEERHYDRRKNDDLTKSRDRDVYSSDIKSKEKKDRDLKAGGKTEEIVHDRRKTDYLTKSNDRELLSSKTKLKEQRDRDPKAKGNTEEKFLDQRKHDDLNISRDRETHSSQMHSMVKMDRDLKSKGSAEEIAHGSSRNDKEQNNKHKSEGSKKHARNLTERDRDLDGSKGFPKRESKRKYHHGDEGKYRDGHHTRRHEMDKGHNAEAIERTKRKEPSKYHYEEIRPKSRRSSSRERDRKRSASPLPRLKKPAVYHGREHEELSVKGKSGQEQFDVDRNKSMNNASSDQYNRHSGSKSGLGGYSPRKRRTTAAARTPSPTKHSPEKRAKWDIALKGVENTSSLPIPPVFPLSNQNASSNIYGTVGAFSVPPAIVKPISGVSSGILPTYMNYSIDSVQLTQATRPVRRLYVENIPAAASEKTVMEWLNNLFISSGVNHILGTQPCISCIIHREKGQALVEFLTPEDASTALSFDGGSLYDSTIKIRRPKDFVEMKTGKLEKSVAVADAVSNIVKDSPGKIFIGGISKALSSEMVMAIAGSFGPLEAYHFDTSDLNGTYAFVEYADQSVASKARAGLNGMKLGGQIISVVEIAPDASNSESIGKPPYGIPEQAKPLLNEPKQVLKLKNVFDPDTLQSMSRTEIEEALEDVRRECMRFGTVKSVNVVKHSSTPIIATEACEINEKMDCVQSQENFRHDETNTEAETVKEAAYSEPVEDDGMGCDKPVENLMDTESFKRGQTDGILAVGDLSGNITTSEEYPRRTTKDEPDCIHDKVIDNIEMKDTNMEDMGSMHGSEELDQQASKDQTHIFHDEGIDSVKLEDASMEEEFPIKEELKLEEVDKRERNEDLGHIFELGCVFVEFGRTEASCAAAHCLHGRLFDNRTVAVEYIPRDIYLTKFPK